VRRTLRSREGFTLLEVTVALAILAVAFTALSALQARNLTLTAETRLLTEGTLAARDLLARLQSGLLPLENAEGGEMGPEHPGWRWLVRIRDEGIPGLRRMECAVFEEHGGPEKGVSFWVLVKKEQEP
jgi:general secretion pathway protein I